MNLRVPRESRSTVFMALLLILLGGAEFWNNQVVHLHSVAHNDARWTDIDRHIDASCGPRR